MRVYEDNSQMHKEFFNECILLLVMYTIFCYSPWVDDIEMTFQIGYITIGIVVLHLVVNLYLIMSSTCKTVSRKCKLRYRKKQLKKARKETMAKLDATREVRMKRRLKLIEEGLNELAVKALAEIDEPENGNQLLAQDGDELWSASELVSLDDSAEIGGQK